MRRHTPIASIASIVLFIVFAVATNTGFAKASLR
jgi:hypothetical protein